MHTLLASMCRHVCAQILQNDCLQDIASMSKHVAAWGRRIWPTACRTDVPACGGMCAHLLHVEAARPDVGGDQDARVAAAELAHDGVALLLRHVAVHRAHRKVVLPHLLRKPVHLIRQPREFLISREKIYRDPRHQSLFTAWGGWVCPWVRPASGVDIPNLNCRPLLISQ